MAECNGGHILRLCQMWEVRFGFREPSSAESARSVTLRNSKIGFRFVIRICINRSRPEIDISFRDNRCCGESNIPFHSIHLESISNHSPFSSTDTRKNFYFHLIDEHANIFRVKHETAYSLPVRSRLIKLKTCTLNTCLHCGSACWCEFTCAEGVYDKVKVLWASNGWPHVESTRFAFPRFIAP